MNSRPNRVRVGSTGSSGIIILAIWLLLAGSPSFSQESAARRECEYGIALALSGQPAKAESVFVSLLSHVPGSATAFTNLGNLRLVGGDFEGALEFYRQAAVADSDAGIVLNQATALLLAGEEDSARARAEVGIQRAGGASAASSLLGLHFPSDGGDSPRGAEPSYLSKEEVLVMLRAAAGRVPVDSSLAAPVASEHRPAAAPVRQHDQWRPAGPRAGDGKTLPTLVYWKRL